MNNGEQSKQYHKVKNQLFYAGLLLDLILLVAFQVSGLSVSVREFSSSFSSSFWVVNGIYLSLFCLGMYLIHFPLNLFLGFSWEHRFKLSTQNFYQWFKDDIKKSALSFLLILILVETIYALLGRFPHYWWIGAGLFWLMISLVLARIFPNVIIPLFYKYSKVEDEQLREQIFQLFEKCKVRLQDVYTINASSKTKKANAFVCGLGKSRRVVLTDTLLSQFSPAEIETVVAHELGHYKHKDILKLTVVNSVVIFIAFFLVDKILGIALAHLGNLPIYDIAAFPVFALALMVFSLFSTPLLNAFSRFLEVGADRYSLQLTGETGDFISLMNKLGSMNLAEFEPGWFNEMMFYDHPPIAKRIKFAENFVREG